MPEGEPGNEEGLTTASQFVEEGDIAGDSELVIESEEEALQHIAISVPEKE